jgi:hypothetical protein
MQHPLDNCLQRSYQSDEDRIDSRLRYWPIRMTKRLPPGALVFGHLHLELTPAPGPFYGGQIRPVCEGGSLQNQSDQPIVESARYLRAR